MNINTALYLADVFHYLNNLCLSILIGGSFTLFILATISFALYVEGDGDLSQLFYSINKIIRKWPILVIVAVIGCLTPTKNTVYMMMASSYLESSSLPPKVAQALEIKLDKYISDLKDEQKK